MNDTNTISSSLSGAEARLFTIKEAAKFLNVSERFISARLSTGEIHSVRLGRCVRISLDEINRLASQGVA